MGSGNVLRHTQETEKHIFTGDSKYCTVFLEYAAAKIGNIGF